MMDGDRVEEKMLYRMVDGEEAGKKTNKETRVRQY
jgi:hypothetical protein